MTVVRVAVGVILDAQNRVCIALRPEGKHLAGYWEFPGGKVEEGETTFDALKRELDEEISIQVQSSEALTEIEFEYPEKTVYLDVHLVREFSGEAKGQESQQVKWVELSQLGDYKFPEANAPILQSLKTLDFTTP